MKNKILNSDILGIGSMTVDYIRSSFDTALENILQQASKAIAITHTTVASSRIHTENYRFFALKSLAFDQGRHVQFRISTFAESIKWIHKMEIIVDAEFNRFIIRPRGTTKVTTSTLRHMFLNKEQTYSNIKDFEAHLRFLFDILYTSVVMEWWE